MQVPAIGDSQIVPFPVRDASMDHELDRLCPLACSMWRQPVVLSPPGGELVAMALVRRLARHSPLVTDTSLQR